MEWIIDRLKESSTWRGIVGLVTACGVYLTPEQADKVIGAGIAIMALINVFRKEVKK